MLTRAALFAALALCPPAVVAGDWPHWRGPQRDGTSTETGLPLRWSETENVAWKLPLPGRSGATPIVVGDRVFLNVSDGERLALWAVDRRSGEKLWERELGSGNQRMRKHDMSSPSPVSDGQRVVVATGTGRVASFDLAGRPQWERDLQADYGSFGLNWGYASSPLLDGDSVYVQVLHGMKTDDPSYLLGLDALTGETRWRVERTTPAVVESPDAYTTPLLVAVEGRRELVVSGGDVVTGHDPASGRELWRIDGLNPERRPNYRIVASPVPAGDLVVVPSRVRPMLAVRPGGRGDVAASHSVWSWDDGPDVPTPVSDGRLLYIVDDKGIASALDLATGSPVYEQQRLPPGTYSASPVLAEGRIYVTSEDGMTAVYQSGPVFGLLARNALDGFTLGSVAISDGQLFLRNESALYCIGTPRTR
jgi:outer membrane protein assembly factor BamB